MNRLRRRLRRRRNEGGFTLVEVTITSALLLIVIAILAPLLTGSLTTFERQSDRSGALDQADLTLQQIEHDVYASSTINVVASPNNELQLIAVLPSAAGDVQSCIEYKVTSAVAPAPLALQRQAWTAAVGSAPSATGWQTLLSALQLNGTGQVAGYVIPNPAGAAPFTSAGNNGQSVAVNLQVQNGTSPVNDLTTTATGVIANPTGASAAATKWASEC